MTTASPLSSSPAKNRDFGRLQDAPDDQPFDIFHIASSSAATCRDLFPGQGPVLVGGTILMDSDAYTTSVRLHGGSTATSSLLTTACSDTESPASFVSDFFVVSMIAG